MIKINVLRSQVAQKSHDEMLAAVAAFEEGRRVKSFSERNPELGKMINCAVCSRRHRSSKVCAPVYTTTMKDENGVEQPIEKHFVPGFEEPVAARVAPSFGKSFVKGRRILKHRNKRSLQVLERAAKIYQEDIAGLFNPSQEDMEKVGKASLSRAINEIRKERAHRRRRLMSISYESRRINRAA